jgi:nicotinate-nucleotide--dimethylbenzimidazole phosphoribosyltransferase
VVVFAGDHGVAGEGVSVYPAEVTAQMCANFTGGGAAVSVLAARVGASLEVVDVGVAADLTHVAGLVHAKVALGTANMRSGPAMTQAQSEAAVEVGRQALDRAADEGTRCVVLGEMGIGNTTSAAVLTALVCRRPAQEVTGPGTGLDGAGLDAKTAVVADIVTRLHALDAGPREWLRQAGGLEIAALVGAMLRARAHRMVVVVDGFIVTAAALLACSLDESVRDQLVFAHRSAEPGHAVALHQLGASPVLDLGMALGEGSGGVLAVPVLRAACDILARMATFADAGVSEAAP